MALGWPGAGPCALTLVAHDAKEPHPAAAGGGGAWDAGEGGEGDEAWESGEGGEGRAPRKRARAAGAGAAAPPLIVANPPWGRKVTAGCLGAQGIRPGAIVSHPRGSHRAV